MIPDDDAPDDADDAPRDEATGDAPEDGSSDADSSGDGSNDAAKAESNEAADGAHADAQEPLDARMRRYAEDAVRYAHGSHNFRLDYSDRSIASVDTIANRIQQYIPRNRIAKWLRPGPTDEEIEHLCQMLGGYIGETYRRLKGGEWAMHEDSGMPGIVREGGWVFPIDKVRKRMRGSQDENLYRYFRVVLDEV
ncbi:MAG: hypothetical protein E6Q50_01985 [Lysobacter sp.]|nr:MAG: hypothetical protein E6Q50_01985 [Lysobacter sp.]